ncbi:hypothetical protein CR513_16273, partial [Mucuna pruriens]
MDPFNGSQDLQIHLQAFQMQVYIDGDDDFIGYKLFPGTLKGVSMRWFSGLLPRWMTVAVGWWLGEGVREKGEEREGEGREEKEWREERKEWKENREEKREEGRGGNEGGGRVVKATKVVVE